MRVIIPYSPFKSFNNKKNNENFILTLYEKFIDIYLLNSLNIYPEKIILSKDQRLFFDKKPTQFYNSRLTPIYALANLVRDKKPLYN